MSEGTQGALVLSVGAICLRLGFTGEFLSYLDGRMRLPLMISGAAMVVLGAVTVLRAREVDDGTERAGAPGRDHEHHGPWAGFLLLVPVLTIILAAPVPLGADAARRDRSETPARSSQTGFAPLPSRRDGAVDLGVGEFVQRAYFDTEDGMDGVPIRLVGFVVTDADISDGYLLTRFQIRCCAADALPVQVHVRGLDGPPPQDDTWVEVVGDWVPPGELGAQGSRRSAVLDVTTQVVVPPPVSPYE